MLLKNLEIVFDNQKNTLQKCKVLLFKLILTHAKQTNTANPTIAKPKVIVNIPAHLKATNALSDDETSSLCLIALAILLDKKPIAMPNVIKTIPTQINGSDKN